MKDSQRRDVVPSGDPPANDRTDPSDGDPKRHAQSSPEAMEQRESGQPGGGAGRRDDVGRTGVYPLSGDERPPGNPELRQMGDWAGGDRGIAGYEDSGGSELVMRDGVVLGGLTSDGAGRPTIDIHADADTPDGGQETDRPERGDANDARRDAGDRGRQR